MGGAGSGATDIAFAPATPCSMSCDIGPQHHAMMCDWYDLHVLIRRSNVSPYNQLHSLLHPHVKLISSCPHLCWRPSSLIWGNLKVRIAVPLANQHHNDDDGDEKQYTHL